MLAVCIPLLEFSCDSFGQAARWGRPSALLATVSCFTCRRHTEQSWPPKAVEESGASTVDWLMGWLGTQPSWLQLATVTPAVTLKTVAHSLHSLQRGSATGTVGVWGYFPPSSPCPPPPPHPGQESLGSGAGPVPAGGVGAGDTLEGGLLRCLGWVSRKAGAWQSGAGSC